MGGSPCSHRPGRAPKNLIESRKIAKSAHAVGEAAKNGGPLAGPHLACVYVLVINGL